MKVSGSIIKHDDHNDQLSHQLLNKYFCQLYHFSTFETPLHMIMEDIFHEIDLPQ